MLKSILKCILYAGAVFCALAGFGAGYLAINTRWGPDYPPDPFIVVLIAIYVALAITPAVMFLTGLRRKTWHWVFIGVGEVIVITLAFSVLLPLITGFGE